MLNPVDEDLRVHRERPVPGDGDAVPVDLAQSGRQHRAGREAHVAGAAVGEGLFGVSCSDIWKPTACASPASKKVTAPTRRAQRATAVTAAGWVRTSRPQTGSNTTGSGEACLLDGFPLTAPCRALAQPWRPSVRALDPHLELLLDRLDELTQRGSGIPHQRHRVVVVRGRVEVGVDVHDVAHLRIAGARAVRLAHRPRAHGEEDVRMVHGVVTAERPLGPSDHHLTGMARRHVAQAHRRHHEDPVHQVREGLQPARQPSAPPPTLITTRSASRSRRATSW